MPRIVHFKYIPKKTLGSEEEAENTSAIVSVKFSSDILKVGKYYRVLLHLSSSKAIAASRPFKVVKDDSSEEPDFDYEFNLEEEGIEDY